MKCNEIKAVHDNDLESFLSSIDELERVNNGRARCLFCEGVINMENIASVFPIDGEVAYCCNSNKCYARLIERGKINA